MERSITVGYLVPEFPGQTHAFFWREIAALQELGIGVALLSTRRPRKGRARHPWAGEAEGDTTYLIPMGLRAGWETLSVLARCGPARLRAAVGAAKAAHPGGGARGSLRRAAFVILGARLASISRRCGLPHIHIHSCADAAAIGLISRRLGGPEYSLTLHGDISHYGAGQREKWGGAAFGTAVARHLAEQVAALGIPREMITVAPMGVEPSKFARQQPYEPASAPGPVRLVACGRLHQDKGHQDVVRATATLRQRGCDARLEILGDGDYRRALESLIAELGLRGSVELAGSVSERDVKERLERAHIFVSGSHDEAVGVATMEAMAMGLPVVATRIGGVPDLVRDGTDGVLVNPGRPDDIADAVQGLIAEPEVARRMGLSGSERIAAEFTSRRSAEALARGLAQLGAERRPSPNRLRPAGSSHAAAAAGARQ